MVPELEAPIGTIVGRTMRDPLFLLVEVDFGKNVLSPGKIWPLVGAEVALGSAKVMVRAGTVNAGMVTNGGSVKHGMVNAVIVNVPVGPPGGAVVVVPN